MSISTSLKAVTLGGVIGFVFAFGVSCGGTKPIQRCNVSNCDGCCDSSGTCLQGTSDSNCGSGASTCVACEGGQSCQLLDSTSTFGGKCVTPGSSGGGDGGSASNDGGSKADAGVCNPTTCANGCCNGSTCVTVTNTAKCGKGGAACAPCNSGNTCVSGACAPCTGCVDISTGQCKPGTEMTACGKTGSFCQTCDSAQGQACNAGVCSGGTSCTAANCPDGCCDGANCKQRKDYNQFQCGSGTPGTACVSCQAECDLDAGTCIGGTGGGGGFDLDGGLFPFPTGCTSSADCTSPNKPCCDSSGPFSTCRGVGGTCWYTDIFGSAKCDGTTKQCQ